MPKKLTNKEFLEKVQKIHGNNFTILNEYVKYQIPIEVKCNKCGNITKITPNNLLKPTHVCKFCGDNGKEVHRSRVYTTEEYIEMAKSIHGDEFDYSKTIYVNRETDIIVGCKKHGFFKINPYVHLKFRGCHECAKEENAKKQSMTHEEFLKIAKSIHGDKYEYLTNYVNAHTPIKIHCKICGENFEQTPHKHIHAKHGCPKCNQSHLETEISQFLTSNNIEFIPQKKFDWLGLKSLDFYLPKYNTAIECQGIQHFEPSDYFGGYKSFNQQQERDKLKKQLCNENNINLLFYSDKKYIKEIFIDKDLLLKEILQ